MSINPYAFREIGGSPLDVQSSPSFGDTLNATLGYTYDPIFEAIGNQFKYMNTFDASYDAMSDMEGYEDYATDLVGAKNANHMLDMKRAIDESKERREVLYNSSMLSQIGAGIFDPINVIALPFGGFGAGIARSALRVGAGVATLQAGQEVARAPFDPLATPEESAFNIGTAFAGGMLLGGLVSIPLTRRSKAQQATQKDIQEMRSNIGTDFDNVNPGEFVYHGTRTTDGNLKSFINEDGNLILRESPDHIVGENQTGVSFGDDLETSLPYTALKDQSSGSRNPKTVGDDDSVVFRIKRDALKGLDQVKESMKETFVKGDVKINKGDFEIIRYGKNNTGNQTPVNSSLGAKQPYIETKTETLLARQDRLPKEMFGLEKNKVKLEKQLDKAKTPEKAKTIQSQLDGINRAIQDNISDTNLIKDELSVRNQTDIEAQTKGIDDPFNIDPNVWTNSWFFKGIPTAFKDALQGKYPNAVKLMFVKLANDSGLRLVLNRYGVKAGSSVNQNKELRNGEWIAIHDKARKLYGEIYSKKGAVMDIDINKKQYHEWLDDIGKKYIQEEPLTENEKIVTTMIKDYFLKWGDDLESVGILGTKVSMEKKLLSNQLKVEAKIKKIKEFEAKIPEAERKVDELLESLRLSNEAQGVKAQSIMDDLDQKKAEGFFTGRMAELEKKLRQQKAKGLYLTDKQYDLLSKLMRQKITKNFLTPKAYDALKLRRQSRDRLLREIDETEANLADIKATKTLPANEETFFPRYFQRHKIRDNRDEFVNILVSWFRQNPMVMVRNKYGEAELRPALTIEEQVKATNPDALLKRANQTTDKILGLDDPSSDAVQFFGHGKSKHFRHRTLDIPNKLVADFIETNPIKVMRVYNQRVAGQYEFAKSFGSRSLDDVLEDIDDEMLKAGNSIAEINKVRKNFMHLHDRIVGRVLRNPNAWNQVTARVLRDFAQLNYLGSAGFATLPDFAKIVMEHELGDVFKGLFTLMRDNRVTLTNNEGRLAGEVVDLLKGDVHMRLVEDITNNPFDDGLMSKIRNGYYVMNGLTPMTHIMKTIDSVVRGHDLIDISIKMRDGKATAKDVMKMAQYNIDEVMARRIAQMPFEKTDGGLYLPNSAKWGDAEAVQAFRSSMNSGILNTVLMGTPADKPNIVDGIVYIPINIAKRFGLKEDAKVRGYARIENGLLGLPFQFYSYSFAAANKITAAFAQDQVKNRATAIVASLSLGYLAMELKNPDFVMEKMSFSDKLARSIDASGMLALYSDVYYRALHTSAQLGGPDIGMGVVNPKFPQKPSMIDPAVDVFGAGPSIALDIGKGVTDMVTGNVSEGAKQVVRNLPGARMWFWKDEMNQLTNSFKSFGRY